MRIDRSGTTAIKAPLPAIQQAALNMHVLMAGNSAHSFGRRGVAAGVAAAVVNAAIYLMERAAGVAFVVPGFQGAAPTRVPVGQVVLVTLMTVLLGSGLAASHIAAGN